MMNRLKVRRSAAARVNETPMEPVKVFPHSVADRFAQALAAVIALTVVVVAGIVILRHVDSADRAVAPTHLQSVSQALNADSVGGYGRVERAGSGGLNADSASGYSAAAAGHETSRGLDADSTSGY